MAMIINEKTGASVSEMETDFLQHCTSHYTSLTPQLCSHSCCATLLRLSIHSSSPPGMAQWSQASKSFKTSLFTLALALLCSHHCGGFLNHVALNTPPTTNPLPHLFLSSSRRREQGARGDERWRINERHHFYFSLLSAPRDQCGSLTGYEADLELCRGFSDAGMNADGGHVLCCQS